MTPEQILELLLGAKVFDGISWRVYDDSGVELTHGPVHWGGVHGMLLTQITVTEPAIREFRPPIVGRGPGTTINLSDFEKLLTTNGNAARMGLQQKQEQARRAQRKRRALNHALLRATAIF